MVVRSVVVEPIASADYRGSMYARDHAIIATPIGFVRIEGDESISRIAIDRDGAAKRASSAAVRAAANQLQEYFAGERITFDLPLAPLSTPRGEALRAAIVAVAAGEHPANVLNPEVFATAAFATKGA